MKDAFILRAAVSLAALLALGACGGDDERVAQLEEDVRSLRATVSRIERRLEADAPEESGERRRVDTRTSPRSAPATAGGADDEATTETLGAPAGAPGAPPAGTEEDPEAVAEAARLARTLGTEAGRGVLAGALRDLEQRRETARRGRVAHAVVGVFAQEADLTPEQANRLAGLLTGAADEIQEMWSEVRRHKPEEGAQELGALVQDRVQKTLDVRRTANEAAREFLSDDQYAQFLEQSGRLHDSLRPGDVGRRAREGGGGAGPPRRQ